MIFPGMDPYLEDPVLWPGVHAAFVVYVRDELQPRLGRRYIASIEERVYLEGPDRDIIPDIWLRETRPRYGEGPVPMLDADCDTAVLLEVPDLEMHERYINILDRASGQQIVTVIEVVSPSNKYPGEGRKNYLHKQREVRASDAHLVEIDLLRTGHHVVAAPEGRTRRLGSFDYLVSVNRAPESHMKFELYPRPLEQRLPRFRVPLAEGDPDVVLDLQAVLAKTYEAGSYADRLPYDQPCRPPLPPAQQAWADALIREAADRAAA